MNNFYFILGLFLFLNFSSHYNQETNTDSKFELGNEVLLNSYQNLLKDKNIGLITNKSGVLSDGTLFLDALSKNYSLKKIFTPEHGLRGDDKVENYTDEISGLPVISLYGKNKAPMPEDLYDIDMMIYDIQDVGARFYTFINTMYYCMESSAANNKEMIVCDRPVIPDGNYIDGFMLDKSEESFVGMINVPSAYGMTCGELAKYINDELLDGRCKLTVIQMKNYSRVIDYINLNLPWIKPSPNIYFPSSAEAYLGTCLFEGTNFSEGRGTDKPFEYVGAPYCDGVKLAAELNSYNLSGVNFESIIFTPQPIASQSNPPKYIGIRCGGVYINVNNKKKFEPVKAVIAILVLLKKLFPEFEINRNNFLDKLSGTKNLRIMIDNGSGYDEIINSYKNSLDNFKNAREKYLLYN